MRVLTIIALALAVWGCEGRKAGFVPGLWQGNRATESFRFSLPYLYHLKGDGTAEVISLNDGQRETIGWEEVGDSLVVTAGDTLQVYTRTAAVLDVGTDPSRGNLRFSQVRQVHPALSESQVRTLLQESTWQKIHVRPEREVQRSDHFTFGTDSVVIRTVESWLGHPLQQYRRSFPYHLLTEQGQTFLAIFDPETPPSFSHAGQILQASEDEIVWFLGKSKSWDTLRLHKMPAPPPGEFSRRTRCSGDYVPEYYYLGTRELYPGNLWAIQQQAQALELPSRPGADGWLRIRFVVNCRGEVGDWSFEEMDASYQYTRFPEELVLALFAFVRDLEGWLPAEENGRPVDFFKHLTFKLKDGQILDVLP